MVAKGFSLLEKISNVRRYRKRACNKQKWGRTKIWETISKIQFLKHKKVTLEDKLDNNDIWIMTVDGMHVWIHKPSHPEFSQDSCNKLPVYHKKKS